MTDDNEQELSERDAYQVTGQPHEVTGPLWRWLNLHGDYGVHGVDGADQAGNLRGFYPKRDPEARVTVYPGDVLVAHPDGSIKVRRHDPRGQG